ncbi:MAG: YbhB/YbcL family Raf kinase inhibitor-like protein, partial [Dehalococcoidia bacterium]
APMLAAVAAFALAACSGDDATATPTVEASPSAEASATATTESTPAIVTPTPPAVAMSVVSPAFSLDGPIPEDYTCDGADTSPPLRIDNIPGSTETLAIVVSDSSAGNFVHWVAWNIAPDALPGGVSADGSTTLDEGDLPDGAVEGVNDFNEIGWAGPCPPAGGPHRYIFYVYALEGSLDLEEGATATELREAVRPLVIFATETMGQYDR